MLSYKSSVTNFSSSKYVQHGGPNGGAAPTQAGQGFPQHYYPSPHEKSQQQLPAGKPDPNSKLRTELSPRQADAVERHAPQRITNNAAPKSTTNTIFPQTTGRSVPIKMQQTPALKLAQGKVHQFPSEQRAAAAQQNGGGMPAPTKTTIIKGPATVNVNMTAISPSAPENYKELVAAPTPQKSYGNYPELTNQAQQKPYSLSVKPAQTVSAPPPKPARAPTQPYIYEEQPNATMETKVAGQGQPKRVGRWTLSQLRQTDGIVPSQAGWNKGDSQKLMTNFGTPRNTSTRVKSENLQEIPEDIANRSHGEVRLQSGTNKYASQKGSTGFGAPRDVCREGVRVSQNPADLPELPEEKIRMSEGIVRLQAGTNKYDSQKGMTGFGTARRETTKMVDSKHPEYDHEKPDQSEIPLQSGTNKFASQKGMTGFGTARRETTKMVDTNHPEYNHECSIDQTTIPSQMGSNKYASQKNMTCFGQGRWEVLDPSISWQNRKSQGMVRLQSGTNRFASQQGMTGFGTIRNTTFEAEGGELPYEAIKQSETIIPSQAGWNKGDSQKKMTSFGAPRDVKGKHLKRIWELEYPEEAEVSLDRL